ncbi:MAG: enoyl-CoA hydratase [Alphaproteobacteria bacterium]|nr:enoyl-CoA hydratase [Alphaproteobacteria bacterium]
MLNAAAPLANEPLVRVQHAAPGVFRLTLNRPKAYNSLSTDLMTALEAELGRLADLPEARAIVLAGAGPGFCAGHDLREVRSLADDAAKRALMAQCCRLMQGIVEHPKPIIAQVHGTASAAGCQLVASCDLALASDEARFATPGVNIGLFCHTPMVALGRNVARKHAMEMLLTGELMDAPTAVRFGLINRAVPASELDGATLTLARQIASKSSHTLKLGKQAFYKQLDLDLGEAYALASEAMLENLLAADAAEGMGAFLEKRSPRWLDR